MKRALFFAAPSAFLVAFALVLSLASAQPAPGSVDAALPPIASAEPGPSLEEAILAAYTLDAVRPDGEPWYVGSCRRAHGGCPARARRLARYLEHSAERHGVNAWTLAAIVFQESGGNPDVIGRNGELGLMQLHPRGRFGQLAARICETAPRACAAAIIDGGAQLLASAIRRCGDERRGLSAYNSGHCERRLEYSDRIIARRERMRGAR